MILLKSICCFAGFLAGAAGTWSLSLGSGLINTSLSRDKEDVG